MSMACSLILHTHGALVVGMASWRTPCAPLRPAALFVRVYSRAAFVLLHTQDAVCVVLGLVRVEHALQLADGPIRPAHGRDPGLQLVRLDLGAVDLGARLPNLLAMYLSQVWWLCGEGECDICVLTVPL